MPGADGDEWEIECVFSGTTVEIKCKARDGSCEVI
jgi:hypothetical protein